MRGFWNNILGEVGGLFLINRSGLVDVAEEFLPCSRGSVFPLTCHSAPTEDIDLDLRLDCVIRTEKRSYWWWSGSRRNG